MIYGDDRELAMELTRGITALAGTGGGSMDAQEDRHLAMFLGLFNPEMSEFERNKLVRSNRAELEKQRKAELRKRPAKKVRR